MSRSIRDPFGRRSGDDGDATTDQAATSAAAGRTTLDPVLAVIIGGVVVAGAGIYLWGGGQDTDPVVTDDPTAALATPAQDDTVKRALAVARSVDAEAADPEQDAAERLADALDAASRGRSVDPFLRGAAKPRPAPRPATGASTSRATTPSTGTSRPSTGAATGSTSPTTGGATTTTTPSAPSRTTTPRITSDQLRQAVIAGHVSLPPRVSVRVATDKGKRSRSRVKIGTILPANSGGVARVVGLSRDGSVVKLRLRQGSKLTGKQSKGTTCVERYASGACKLVHVRAGKVAVLQAPRRKSGPGAVTAVRILSTWRGDLRMDAGR
ncbi:MAG: hypothetical protein M0P31_06680 [Solirubrobacteraceae bacterium]|nr:hypothetical protein [Solirubrobacteraceae bacterium]